MFPWSFCHSQSFAQPSTAFLILASFIQIMYSFQELVTGYLSSSISQLSIPLQVKLNYKNIAASLVDGFWYKIPSVNLLRSWLFSFHCRLPLQSFKFWQSNSLPVIIISLPLGTRGFTIIDLCGIFSWQHWLCIVGAVSCLSEEENFHVVLDVITSRDGTDTCLQRGG